MRSQAPLTSGLTRFPTMARLGRELTERLGSPPSIRRQPRTQCLSREALIDDPPFPASGCHVTLERHQHRREGRQKGSSVPTSFSRPLVPPLVYSWRARARLVEDPCRVTGIREGGQGVPTVTAVVVAWGPSPHLPRCASSILGSEGVDVDLVV